MGNIQFVGTPEDNLCLCCGEPTLDFYHGSNWHMRATVKHGSGMMLDAGSVVALTAESRKWLRAWLSKNGMTNSTSR